MPSECIALYETELRTGAYYKELAIQDLTKGKMEGREEQARVNENMLSNQYVHSQVKSRLPKERCMLR